MDGFYLLLGHLLGDYILQNDWMAANKTTRHLPCLVHCALYTLCVWACSFWWMPWWGVALCFAAHYPVDRWRLARWWMVNVSRQEVFASAMAPWSVVVVDNTFHLLALAVIHATAQTLT